jgi:hypothetical protein
MVSNNYYGNTHSYDFNESLKPGNSQPPSNNSSRNDLDSIYNKYSTPSPYHSLTPTPSYESTDRTPYNQPQRGYAESENGSSQTVDQYADNIPLKPSKQTPLRTDWRAENTEYPPSPESQRDQGIGLVPHPTPMNKKGWLSGKIPWVVYVVSTVQIAVFIAEIVKNCTFLHRPSRRHITDPPSSNRYRLSHHDSSTVQPHDRPVNLCSHQHGCSFRPMYANHPRSSKLLRSHKLALPQHHKLRPDRSHKSLRPVRTLRLLCSQLCGFLR